MATGELEYMLLVWEKKPTKLSLNLSRDNQYWRAHITKAHAIPTEGQLITSGCGLDDYSTYRVFDVWHDISPCFASLVLNNISKVNEAVVPEGEQGLVHVLAYLEK